MDKYQKFILDRIKYASNFVFCHCTPTSNTLDGSMEQYGVFETMQKNGYYEVQPADKTVIDEKINTFSKTLKNLEK